MNVPLIGVETLQSDTKEGQPSLRCFKRIDCPSVGLAVHAATEELVGKDRLWYVNVARQKKIAVQRNTESIPLRAPVVGTSEQRRTEDIEESELTRLAYVFPRTISVLNQLAVELQGTLERAMFVRLLPQSVVYPHIDSGAYYEKRDRYHLVLDSPDGSIMRSGGEEVTMMTGELWWFDNHQMHDSCNPSQMHRVHLIFDIF